MLTHIFLLLPSKQTHLYIKYQIVDHKQIYEFNNTNLYMHTHIHIQIQIYMYKLGVHKKVYNIVTKQKALTTITSKQNHSHTDPFTTSL